MPNGRILQHDPPVVRSDQTRRDAAGKGREDVKLGRSPGLNLVRDERSSLCIIAYVERREDQEDSCMGESFNNIRELDPMPEIVSPRRVDEYTRSDPTMELELNPGETRGYWKYHAPGNWFKQAKSMGKINNERATLLFDSGAEVSIIDTTFARKVGCVIDESQKQECVGIGDNSYMTVGRTRIKITLAGSLVYHFEAWVGDQSGQEAILGMDFMIPAGLRLDFANGTLCLPDEVRIQLVGRRPLYSDRVQWISSGEFTSIPIGSTCEIPIRPDRAPSLCLWVTSGRGWVPTVTTGVGRRRHLLLTNITERVVCIPGHTKVAIWLAPDAVPRAPGYVSLGSRRYAEWQNLAFQSTVDPLDDGAEEISLPQVERQPYPTPRKILA